MTKAEKILRKYQLDGEGPHGIGNGPGKGKASCRDDLNDEFSDESSAPLGNVPRKPMLSKEDKKIIRQRIKVKRK